MDSDQQRKLLEAAFEPHGDGYVFYRNNFTPGLPVSKEERDAYLKRWSLSSTAIFYSRIKSRTPVKPARGFTGTKAILRTMPISFAVGYLSLAATFALIAFRSEGTFVRVGEFSLSALFFICGTCALVFRRTGERKVR